MLCSKSPSPAEAKTITRLIEAWKAFPCLWNKADEYYGNKEAKTFALQELLEIYQEFKEDASMADLKNKLENLRTSYKREMKKVEGSKSTGSGSENVRLPKLWYYDLMDFVTQDGIEKMEDSQVISEPTPRTLNKKTTPTKRKLGGCLQLPVTAGASRLPGVCMSRIPSQ